MTVASPPLRTSPAAQLAFLYGPGGPWRYPLSAFAGWPRAAGFEKVERIDLTAYPPVSLIRARRC